MTWGSLKSGSGVAYIYLRRGAYLLTVVTVLLVATDWWMCLPDDTRAHYIGGSSCIQCHSAEASKWKGSDHDRAMEVANEETVLGDFDAAELIHFGIRSKMYRRDGKFLVHTEGVDGQATDFDVEYVFGWYPLQQYLVRFDQDQSFSGDGEIGRLQVLPISWDTQKKEWFWLTPDDVRDEKIQPDDPLYWTHLSQSWNYMCADCHSTNVRKHFDTATLSAHVTFSDLNVNCESCHGPGSIHVQLAEERSLFWDRKRGFGLHQLKNAGAQTQVETCAPCHSRRGKILDGGQAGDAFLDHHQPSPILPHLYHADGQILDEVYVYGSFVQSKMYQKGIRCTDCHDPHTTRIKHEGNRLCTSCHQHSAGKYDSPSHHHHQPGSSGSQCVACHMPVRTYMAVDARRDHSLRVPRPDLSVRLKTPNACTTCHLESDKLPPKKRETLLHYEDWLISAKQGDEQVDKELARVDAWCAAAAKRWYGEPSPHPFADAMHASWLGDPEAERPLTKIVKNKKLPSFVRASALHELQRFNSEIALNISIRLLQDFDSQVRFEALGKLGFVVDQFVSERGRIGQQIRDVDQVLRNPQLVPAQAMVLRKENEIRRKEFLQIEQQLQRVLVPQLPLLDDPVRLVRWEVARNLATVPDLFLQPSQLESRDKSLGEFFQNIVTVQEPATAFMNSGALYDRMARNPAEQDLAVDAYRTSLRIGVSVVGLRTNLANLLENRARRNGQPVPNDVQRLRHEELVLFERDISHLTSRVPLLDQAAIYFQYGIGLYRNGQNVEAEKALEQASKLALQNAQYLIVVVELQHKLGYLEKARQGAERLVDKWPENQEYRLLYESLKHKQPSVIK